MEDEVVYIGCPHCGAGWYGKMLYAQLKESEEHKNDGVLVLDKLIIEGMFPTDITKPIKCLNCGKKYTPVDGGIAVPETGFEYIQLNNTRVAVMDRWVAERVMNTKGS